MAPVGPGGPGGPGCADSPDLSGPGGVVLLAAGLSERFGGNKLLAPFWEKTVLETAFAALPRGVEAVAVVCGQGERELCRAWRIRAAVNSRPQEGVSSSIRLGLEIMGGKAWCLFMVADQPLLRRQTAEAIVAAHTPGRITVPLCRGLERNPVIFPSRCFGALRALEGDQGGKAVAAAFEELVERVETGEPWEFEDADTVQALEALRKHKEARHEGV